MDTAGFHVDRSLAENLILRDQGTDPRLFPRKIGADQRILIVDHVADGSLGDNAASVSSRPFAHFDEIVRVA